MKRCPECRKDYLDDSLLYCLDDGNALVQGSVTDEPATAILSGDAIAGERPTRMIDAAHETATPDRSEKTVTTSVWRLRIPWIASGVFALAALGLAFANFNRGSSTAGAVRLSFKRPAELSFNDVQPDAAVISPDGRASFLAELGEKEEAIKYLEKGAARGDYWLFSIKYDLAFNSLREDSRFKALVKKFDSPQ